MTVKGKRKKHKKGTTDDSNTYDNETPCSKAKRNLPPVHEIKLPESSAEEASTSPSSLSEKKDDKESNNDSLPRLVNHH